MYRNISIVVFVFFGVVLGLPESQGGCKEYPHPATITSWADDTKLWPEIGEPHIICHLLETKRFESLIYRTCQLVCGERYVQLPEDACSRGAHKTCTRRLKNELQKWGNGMMERKKILCRL
uniref:Putative ixodes 10 kDa peptide protein n=1 Tax=Ixodes ricinus TaxID=34613 RepID=A0A0K8RBJ1_IXORI